MANSQKSQQKKNKKLSNSKTNKFHKKRECGHSRLYDQPCAAAQGHHHGTLLGAKEMHQGKQEQAVEET